MGSTPDDVLRFIRKVRGMRSYQKLYFRSRQQHILQQCKLAERQVDDAAVQLLAELQSGKQKGLWDDK